MRAVLEMEATATRFNGGSEVDLRWGLHFAFLLYFNSVSISIAML